MPKITIYVNTPVKYAEVKSMKRHINFEDNVFLINIRIRMLNDTLILDADEELFLTKTMDDLDFIDGSLATLYFNLQENSRLVDRVEQFYNLGETEQQYCEVLNRLGNSDGNVSAIKYPELRERIVLWLSRSRDRQHSINELIAGSKHQTMEPVVGQDELQELLSCYS